MLIGYSSVGLVSKASGRGARYLGTRHLRFPLGRLSREKIAEAERVRRALPVLVLHAPQIPPQYVGSRRFPDLGNLQIQEKLEFPLSECMPADYTPDQFLNELQE